MGNGNTITTNANNGIPGVLEYVWNEVLEDKDYLILQQNLSKEVNRQNFLLGKITKTTIFRH
jgi:hypothetical protein